ncbi:MAG TPA: hypothetical protein VM243_07710 [Phycisphaerae bacterium]|nr:hypothetical protein [Phycisphaerae bacterium]
MMPSNDDNEQLEFLLSQYLDGDLDEATLAEVERRLATDAELAASLATLRRTNELIRAWGGPVPEVDSDRFVEESAVRREAEDAWRHRRRILRLYAPLSAAAMILLAFTLHLAIRSPQLDSTGRSVAMVSVQRDDDWRRAPGLGDALAQVRFDRTPPRGTSAARSASRPVVAIAAAGASPSAGDTIAEETPYF